MTNFNTQARGFAQDDVNTYLVKVFTKMQFVILQMHGTTGTA